MSNLSIEATEFLNKCFYLSFIDTRKYKTDLEQFIDKKGDNMSFSLCDFIQHQRDSKDTLDLVPIDVFFESECSAETIKSIEEDFNNRTVVGGYSRLLLEYLFDEQFKRKFNEFICNNESELFSDSYFKTKTEDGLFDYDLIGEYFNKIKGAYCGKEWKFDAITKRKAVRSVKSPKGVLYLKDENGTKKRNPNALGPERLKNIYSTFKIYGQGVYSGILVSLLAKKKTIQPEKLFEDCITVITNDSKEETFNDKNKVKLITSIKDSFSNKIIPGKKTSVVYKTIHVLQVNKVYEQLQRFFEDYVPSHLERVFVFDGINKGDTLRRQLIRDFRGIAKDEWKKHKNGNNDNTVNDELFHSRYYRKIIEKEFYGIYKETQNEKKPETIIEKLEYILKNEADCLKSRTWKRIINMYNIGKPEQYESEEILDRKIENQRDGKLLVDDTEDKHSFSGYAGKLYKLLQDAFDTSNNFINILADRIEMFYMDDSVQINIWMLKLLKKVIRRISPTLTVKNIERIVSNQFYYEQLKESPFNFTEEQIKKVRILLLLEIWRFDPKIVAVVPDSYKQNKDPWRSIRKLYFISEGIHASDLSNKMEQIYEKIRSIV